MTRRSCTSSISAASCTSRWATGHAICKVCRKVCRVRSPLTQRPLDRTEPRAMVPVSTEFMESRSMQVMGRVVPTSIHR